jgi:hypothetical protein
MPHQAGSEAKNGETLSAALRVPDHARATIARLSAVHFPGPVTVRRFFAQHTRIPLLQNL